MLKDFRSEVFDIVIQGGQSNADGSGFGPADEPFEPNPDILYLTTKPPKKPTGKT